MTESDEGDDDIWLNEEEKSPFRKSLQHSTVQLMFTGISGILEVYTARTLKKLPNSMKVNVYITHYN